MHLYLIRHAIATERGTANDGDDRLRPLTATGVKRFARVAKQFAGIEPELTEIWTSPLVRAAQTAELLAAAFPPRVVHRTLEALSPGGALEEIERQLIRNGGAPAIALVGHNPDLGILGTYLITGLRREALRLKKGGIARIDIAELSAPMRGELRFMLTPKLMR